MKESIKLVAMHFFIITVGVMFFTSIGPLIECGLSGKLVYPGWYPWMVMLTGLVGAIPSFLFHFKKDSEPTRKEFQIRIVLHFIVIETLIMIMGWVFKWYDGVFEALIVAVTIFAVYLFVWFFSYRINTSLAKNINEALKRINDDDEE